MLYYFHSSYRVWPNCGKCNFIVGILRRILGIIQYFKRTTIFSPYYNGKPYLNTIFYLDGFSSNNPVYLSLGAQVRSFGTMDSGLSFGIFMLLCVAIVLARTTFSRFGKMVRLVFLYCDFWNNYSECIYRYGDSDSTMVVQ